MLANETPKCVIKSDTPHLQCGQGRSSAVQQLLGLVQARHQPSPRRTPITRSVLTTTPHSRQ